MQRREGGAELYISCTALHSTERLSSQLKNLLNITAKCTATLYCAQSVQGKHTVTKDTNKQFHPRQKSTSYRTEEQSTKYTRLYHSARWCSVFSATQCQDSDLWALGWSSGGRNLQINIITIHIWQPVGTRLEPNWNRAMSELKLLRSSSLDHLTLQSITIYLQSTVALILNVHRSKSGSQLKSSTIFKTVCTFDFWQTLTRHLTQILSATFYSFSTFWSGVVPACCETILGNIWWIVDSCYKTIYKKGLSACSSTTWYIAI